MLLPVAAAAAAGADAGSRKPGPKLAWKQWWQLEQESDVSGSGVAAGGMDLTAAPQDMRSILSKVGRLLAPDRSLLICAVFFMLAAAASELCIPHFITTAVFSAAKASLGATRTVRCKVQCTLQYQ
jgi:hypothetical protein